VDFVAYDACPGCMVHEGFDSAYRRVNQQVCETDPPLSTYM
jgi:hypothetical protein